MTDQKEPEQFKTTNLLLASLLESGGASIDSIETGKKFSTVTLTVPPYCKDSLQKKAERLLRVIERIENTEEWRELFNISVLGEMEDKYVKLKRRLTRNKQ
jgi:hypothetical protein